MRRLHPVIIWVALAMALCVPLAFAATSSLIQWRQPIYIVAGFAGVLGLALMLLQPLLVAGLLPGLPALRGRRVHRVTGAALAICVLIHVLGLWVFSPPDVVDALLFVSATPFSVWGVVAMWAMIAIVVLAVYRRRLRLRWRTWRLGHSALAVVMVIGTVVHAALIQGTMETISKTVLCVLVVIATSKTLFDLRVWSNRPETRR